MRVVIGEDEALLREGLSLVLDRGGITVAAMVDDATALPIEVARHQPDLVLTDIRMPPDGTDDGLRAALAIRRAQPQMPIVVLSQHVQRQYAVELLRDATAGTGYLLKHRIAATQTFVADLRRVADGAVVLDPEVVETMIARATLHDEALEALTPRQRDVLRLIAEGRSNQGIAKALVIAEKTVVQHTSSIYDRLGLADRDDDHRRVLAALRYLAG